MEIIPAIDIIDGKCVRLTQGDYAQKKIYNEDPLEMAKQFEDSGLRRLHLVDLDGAKEGKVINIRVLERIANNTSMIIDFGGGIKDHASIEQVFNAGARYATLGSIAVKDELLFEEWVKCYGADAILLGADVKNEKIAISGWLEETKIAVIDFIRKKNGLGIKNVFCTDVAKDGLLQGPSIELYEKIISACANVNLIASGGVSTMEDLRRLAAIGCSGAIVGKAIYEGRIKLNELKEFI